MAPARGIVLAPVPDGHIEGRRVLPSLGLSPFVHHFWSVRWVLRSPFAAVTLPHPSARIELEVAPGVRRSEITGVRTGRVARAIEGEGQFFGIAFRPAMFQPLWRASMASLTDRVVPVGQLLGPKADAWAREIHEEKGLDAKFAITEAFLAPLLPPLAPEIARLRDLVEHMALDRSLLRVEDAAAVLDVDVRALQRRFRRYVGVSPKWVIQRYRMHEAAERLKGENPPTLAALAASLGYADQAHFAREFKLVVGQTPGAFGRRSADRRPTATRHP